MTPQPLTDQPERDLPDSNTLGGTTSTGAGPDGEQDSPPAPTTPGIGYDDLNQQADVAGETDE